MKRLLSMILASLLIVSAVSVGVSAESLEEVELGNIVKGYLQAQADAKYLAENEGLTAHTLAELSEDELQNVQDTVTQSLVNSDSLENSITVDVSFAEYMEEKARYIQYTRQAENLNISNYSVTYGTPEIEMGDGVAKVKIFETVSMQYDGLDEMSAISTEYVLDLIQVNNQWIIVNITSDDMFDRSHPRESFNYETAVAEYDAAMSAPSEIVVEQDVSKLIEELEAAGTSPIAYDRTSAANYSLTFTTSTGSDTRSYYNDNFANYVSSGGDCMNYASQCLYAGFGGSDDKAAIDGFAFPMDRTGSSDPKKWFTNSSGGSWSPSWIGTQSFLNYANAANGDTPSEDNILFNVYKPSAGVDLSGIYNWQNRLLGSVVLLYDDGHAMVISKVTGSSPSQIFVSAHTSDVKLVPLSQCFDSTDYSLGYHIIVPEGYYSYTNTPNCRVVSKWQDAVAQNITLNLSATAVRKSGGSVYRMAMRIITPSGAEQWQGETLNTTKYSKSYQFTEKGLYTITVYARETSSSSNSVSSTISVRVY